jgi:pimeloyl-ACP methyl ester carboxylesterase
MRLLPCLLLLASTANAAPTVVLQAGLGDGKVAWKKVMPALEKQGPVYAYDRAGYGGAAATEGTRDPCTIARELHDRLRKEGIQPPYLLVGHSLGGLYQYVYARLYPEDVAGLVLLDPTHPFHWQSMQQEAPGPAALVRTMTAVAPNSATRHEFRDQAVCLDKVDMSQPITAPVRLLASGKGSPGETPAFKTMLNRLRMDWLRLTGASQVEVIERSGHYLQKDAPAEVVKAIEDVRNQAESARVTR